MNTQMHCETLRRALQEESHKLGERQFQDLAFPWAINEVSELRRITTLQTCSTAAFHKAIDVQQGGSTPVLNMLVSREQLWCAECCFRPGGCWLQRRDRR